MTLLFNNLKTFAFDSRHLRTVLIAGTLILSAMYIWQVNAAATTGFTMRDLESGIAELRLEQERMNLEVAQLQSVDSVSQRVQMLGLSEVKTIEYLTPGSGSVAINR